MAGTAKFNHVMSCSLIPQVCADPHVGNMMYGQGSHATFNAIVSLGVFGACV